MGLNPANEFSLDGVIVTNNRRPYCHFLGLVARSAVKLSFLKTRSEKLSPFLIGAGICRLHVPPALPINVRNKPLNMILHWAFTNSTRLQMVPSGQLRLSHCGWKSDVTR